MKKLAIIGLILGLCIILAYTFGNHARAFNPTAACIHNLQMIDGAKEQWTLEHHMTTNDTPTWADIHFYLDSAGLTNEPLKCPGGGIYTIEKVGKPPKCSVGGQHTLPSSFR